MLWSARAASSRREAGEAPDNQEPPRGHSRTSTEQQATARGVSTTRSALVFTAAAVVTLVAGAVLERSGDAIAGDIGLSGVLFGATVLAAATSLPELSTGLTSVRKGDYQLAMSDIFGRNAFLPVLFLLAGLLSGKAVLPQAQRTDIYLTALGVLLTLVYLTGLVFRPQRRIARMGVDSLAVLVLYALGVAGLFAVAGKLIHGHSSRWFRILPPVRVPARRGGPLTHACRPSRTRAGIRAQPGPSGWATS